MSISNDDIYNFDQSLTGIGIEDLQVNTITTKYLNGINATTISYLDATSSIQTQLNYLEGAHSTTGGGFMIITGELNGGFVIGSSFIMGSGSGTMGTIVPVSYVYGIENIYCLENLGYWEFPQSNLEW